jgi:hypothetical protein
MKYTIIGSINGYELEDIVPFILSIHESGFDGQKIMIVYEDKPSINAFLSEYGWEIIHKTFYKSTVIFNQRLIDAHNILCNIKTDIVIFLDVFDIIFNKNPTTWIEQNFNGDILATSESLKFKDDDWSTYIGTFFPEKWDWLKEKEIYNCGVIIGKRKPLIDLLYTMFYMGIKIDKNNYPFDQITFNIEIHNPKYNTQFLKQQEGFVCHLTLKNKYKEPYYFTEDLPKIIDFKVYNKNDEEFFIYHQYNKFNDLKNNITSRYNFKKKF